MALTAPESCLRQVSEDVGLKDHQCVSSVVTNCAFQTASRRCLISLESWTGEKKGQPINMLHNIQSRTNFVSHTHFSVLSALMHLKYSTTPTHTSKA